jgi:hypothetical protein
VRRDNHMVEIEALPWNVVKDLAAAITQARED